MSLRRPMIGAEWAPLRSRLALTRLLSLLIQRRERPPVSTADRRVLLSYRDAHNAVETYLVSAIYLGVSVIFLDRLLTGGDSLFLSTLMSPVTTLGVVILMQLVPGFLSLVTAPLRRSGAIVNMLTLQETVANSILTAAAVFLMSSGRAHVAWTARVWLLLVAINLVAAGAGLFLRRHYEARTILYERAP